MATTTISGADLSGKTVFSADGEAVGTVKAVRPGYFAVNAPMAPDYWLSTGFVEKADLVVQLSLRAREVTEHKLDDPG